MNISFTDIAFRHPNVEQTELIHDWLQQPHVKKFFDDRKIENIITDLNKYFAGKDHFWTPWIAFHLDTPFAYLLTSEVLPNERDEWVKWRDKNAITLTLDLLIGDANFLDKGISTKLIKKFIENRCYYASSILIALDAKNAKAIHVFEKAGFDKVDEFKFTQGKHAGILHVMMKIKLENVAKYFFETKRIGFKLLKSEDIAYLEKLDADPEVRHFFPSGVLNREQIEVRISDFIVNYHQYGLPCFVLFELETEMFMGRAGFAPLDTGEIEVGYVLHKKYWGKGYASEALAALLEWATKNIDADYIIAYTPVEHKASQRVLEKCGMEYYKNAKVKGIPRRFYKIKNRGFLEDM